MTKQRTVRLGTIARPDGQRIEYQEWLTVISASQTFAWLGSTRARTRPGMRPVVNLDFDWGRGRIRVVCEDPTAETWVRELAAGFNAQLLTGTG